MKSFTKVVLVAALAVVPLASFAQSSPSPTRAQVRAQLEQLEKAGYNPRDWVHYPENIQAAEAKVAAQNAAAQGAVSGYGGDVDGTSRSGRADGL
ncbi:DUF4148 domain-containing protein [Paraburkholderia xenovorans]|uniref:DUF4148 domain-containing protein n=1 Tax=Paraburkholderia xenovorans TaxID=36873 RepID=UPI0038B88E2C